MSARANHGITGQVGRLLEAARVRAHLHQWQVAERAGTSQQWVSRVERGDVDLRLRDAERLFAAVGRRIVVQTAALGCGDVPDPDLLGDERAATELGMFVAEHEFLWRRFEAVPYVVAGRLAALAQGLNVRPVRVDLVIAEAGVAAADGAMAWLNASRWNETRQDWTGYDTTVSGAGPRRWRLTSGFELRITVVDTLPDGLVVSACGRSFAVVPLVRLLADDADVAELAKRAGRGEAAQRRAFRHGRRASRIRP